MNIILDNGTLYKSHKRADRVMGQRIVGMVRLRKSY